MHMREQWQLHCTSQWGWQIPLSERVYCVTVRFKMTEWVEQQICIKHCVKVEHSSMETTQMIQKAEPVGNWWLASSSRQHTCSCITSGTEFFGETSNHLGDSAPLQPRFDALWLLAFPQTKVTFEGEGISDCWWDSGKYNRAADGNWENCVRSQGAYFWRGLRHHCPKYKVSCILYLLQEMSLLFILHGWMLSGQTSYILELWTWSNVWLKNL